METSSRAPKRHNRWDYRGMGYPGNPFRDKHPHDQSLVTCIGHTILRTLIRSHFSPSATTGQRYLYSGSADGHIYVYDLSGTLVR
jgi:WD repeat-containing protein 23